MRKGRLVVAGIVAIVAAIFVWWLAHKGGGGVHEPPAPAAGSAAAPVHADVPAPPAHATLGGRVTDDKGKPIAGAVVRLAPQRDGDARAARSGADGAYAFDDLEPGRFAAAAAAQGFLARDGGELALAPGEHRTLDFQLAPGGKPLTGTVTDATGGPIAGALVEAARERGMLSGTAPDVAAAFTDDAGHYAMTAIEGAYNVSASHGEYVGATQRALVGATGAIVDFALIPGGAIEGTVEDATTGQGVAGARVEVEREALMGVPGGTMTGARGRARAIADGAGHFRVGGLEPGTISIRARAPGRASIDPTVVPLGVAENVTGVIVIVQASASVSGTIVDDSGKPAPDTTAFLMGERQIDNAQADASGAFTFEGVQPGSYTLAAGGGGFLDSAAPVPITVERTPIGGVKLVVRKGAAIRGKVDPPQVAHVEIAHDLADDTSTLDLRALMETRVSTESAADGTFTLGPVDPGPADVAAHAADGKRGKVSVQVAAGGADGVVIHLDAGATITGRVTDGKDAVAGAIVTARHVKSNNRTAVIVNGVDLGADRAPTGADGRFAVTGLVAGDYELQVLDDRGTAFAWRAPADKEHPAAGIKVVVAANDRKDVSLEVERPHGVIKGVVLGDDGKPVADAWVSASRGFDADFGEGPPPGPPPAPAAGSGSDGAGKVTTESTSMMVVRSDDGGDDGGIFGGVPPVLTGPDGRFELAHLRRGKYQVMAEGLKGRARGAQDDVEPDADITIHLASLTELTGTVTSDGAPVGDFTVELDGPARRQQRFIAADGHFTIQRVDPGTYDVSVSAKEGTGHAQVVVTAGQHADTAIALVGHVRVTGRVVDASGAPVAHAPVVTAPYGGDHGPLSISMEGPPDTTGADGTFAIDVEPGKRLLVVLGGTGPILTQPFEAKSGEAIDLGTLTAKPRPEMKKGATVTRHALLTSHRQSR